MMEVATKKEYKQTEIGSIPSEWKVNQLQNLSEKIMVGIASAATHAYRNSGVIMFRNQNIKSNFLDDRDVLYISLEYEELFKGKRLKTGDLLTARTGYPGTTCLLPEKYHGSQSFTTLITRPNQSKIESSFLCYYINSEIGQKFFETNQIGGGQKNVNAGTLKFMPIPIPPLHEQKAIASALKETDDLILSLEELIAKKKLIKQGAMQELLKPKEGWVTKKLGEVALIVRGASPRPIEDPKWFDYSSSIGWVRISDVTKSNKFLKSTIQKLSADGVKSSRFVEENNLIMSICATVGRPILTEINVCIHDGFVVFKNPTIEKEYLYYFLSFIEKDWANNGQTGSQMNLNTELINKTLIPYPSSKKGQLEIASIIADLDDEINILDEKLSKYKTIKQGMMQQLLTGKIRLI
jgi:type I restriction enzyme S subunit